jgi:CRP-like cAMP-binding protein
MTQKIFVTDAQVKAARMLVEINRDLGRETDDATLVIASHGRDDDEPPSRPGQRGHPDQAGETGSIRSDVNFWDVLDPKQQDQLRSVGAWQTFRAGAVIMREGEPADYIVVILGGRAKITVYRDGRERVLAFRGIGQLIGERAAQRVNVRSATVTALEMVWALVVQTRDFAAFTMGHQDVLKFLDDQTFERLTEERPRSGRGAGGWRRLGRRPAPPDRPGHDRMAESSRHRPGRMTDENRTVLLSDVVGFDAGKRTDGDRAVISQALRGMMETALQGISDARTEDRGDGLLTVLPAAVSPEEMRNLLAVLPAALERHNRDQRDAVRFQVRIAVNVGPVSGRSGSLTGEAIDIAAELLAAPPFQRAGQGTSIGIIISPFVYETVVRPGRDLDEVANYTQLPVEVKESSTIAWVRQVPAGSATA